MTFVRLPDYGRERRAADLAALSRGEPASVDANRRGRDLARAAHAGERVTLCVRVGGARVRIRGRLEVEGIYGSDECAGDCCTLYCIKFLPGRRLRLTEGRKG